MNLSEVSITFITNITLNYVIKPETKAISSFLVLIHYFSNKIFTNSKVKPQSSYC